MILALALPLSSGAALAPYSVDAATLHLWHLDEPPTPCIDSAPGGTNLTVLSGGASLDNASFAGFGAALSTFDGGQSGTAASDKNAALSVFTLTADSGDNVSMALANETNGAFTFDAIVRVDFDPALNMATRGSGMQIISGEGDVDPERVFQLRLDPVGFGGGDNSVPRIEFINIRQNAGLQSIIMPIPTNGTSAIASNQWYHVAVAYNGNENSAGNISFYWTLLDTNASGANLIGSDNMINDLVAGAACDFVVGNEGRSTGGASDNWIGLIDEVRISSVAREPNEFVFRRLSVLEASGWQDPNVPENTLDGDLGTRWSAQGDGQWITYDLGRSELVEAIDIAFYLGNTRTAAFDVLLSDDNVSWLTALTNATSSGTTLSPEAFDLPDFLARYVRIVGHGNSQSDWNSLTEVVIHRSSALDADDDGLPDNWEVFFFTNITAYGGTSDPDTDTFDNLAEYLGGSNPTNSLSIPTDTDADGLPDAWEQLHFSSLAYGPDDDPDEDDFTNQQEYQGGSSPNDGNSTPGGSQVIPGPPLAQLVPIEDGDTNTSEYGYAGSSAINAVSFIRSALVTVSNKQVIAYYGRHQTNSAYAFNNRIWVARRTVGSNLWEVFRTSFQPNNIADGHDVVCFGIDGDGVMHMSWGMHGDAFHYARSITNVVGNEPIAFGPDTTMTGTTNENTATYPQFLTLPGGDLLYIYRKGGSGSGNTFINRYVRATKTWTNVHHVGGAALPFIKGTGWSPDYNAYLQMPCLDAAGGLFLVWTWRDTPAYQSNSDLAFARSLDGGVSWQRFDGVNYDLPISEFGESGNPNTTAERILQIPQNSSLINQSGMTLDADGNPVVATWWAPGTPTNNFRRQYMVVLRSTNGWAVRQVSQRTNDPIGTNQQDGVVRDLGRPVVVTDSQDRIIILYRDNFLGNGLTIVHSLPKAVDPDRLVWTTFDLTTNNLGNYEPVIDLARWQMDDSLHVLYQPSSGLGYTPPANTASQIGVLEWNAAAYFQHTPTLNLEFTNWVAVLSFAALPSWGYRLSMSTNLSSWQPLSAWNNINGVVQYVHQNGGNEPQQFWKLEYQEGGIAPP